MSFLYKGIDIFFFVFHIALIIFNLFGWAFRKTRKLNLITLIATAFSWFVLGIFYGFGYCFLTDWHWQIREKLDQPITSNSYIHFLLTELFNVHIAENIVDILTAAFFFAALIISIVLNIRDLRSKVGSRQEQ